MLDGLAKDGKAAMAGAAARYGGALFGWAIRRGILADQPIRARSRSLRPFAATAYCRTMKSAVFGGDRRAGGVQRDRAGVVVDRATTRGSERAYVE